MRENRKKTIRISLLILILLLGIGYAALTAKLKVDGTVHIDKTTWDVHFENVQVTEGSVEANPAPTTNNVDTTSMTYTINFTKPGDFYEFTVDVVNDGTIDAMVSLVTNNAYANASSTTPITLPSYLTSTVTYENGSPINQTNLLAKETSEKIKVRVEFKKDIQASDLPSSGDTTVVFKFKGNFKQADETACPIPTTFADDDWDTIQCNVKQNPSSYPLGAEKTISMDIDGDNTDETYTLRVANNTTPSECSTTGFSQSACGFVVEFTGIITLHYMNPTSNDTTNGNGSVGGWEYSDMRAYLNSGKYLEGETGEVDYTNDGVYKKLPTELKKVIVKTTVVSGYNTVKDSSNFTTEDKLYLLSRREVFNKTGEGEDTAQDLTRQLDYYKEKKVSGTGTNSYTEKTYLPDSPYYQNLWWLRSMHSSANGHFNGVGWSGYSTSYTANNEYGVSPAFRIG